MGHHVDPQWDEFTKKRSSVRQRIERIYFLLNKPVDFGSGIMQRVIQLFQMRRLLVHPQFQETLEERSTPPPNLFDHVDADFPASKSREIAESFRDTLLGDAQMENLWRKESYAEKHKPARFQREV